MRIEQLPALTPEIVQALGQAIRDGADDLAVLIQRGKCQLYAVNGDSYLVTEIICPLDGHKRLMLHCYAGRGVREILALMERVAKLNDCDSIMFQTHRPGIRKIAGQFGYAEETRLYRKKLK